MLAGRIGSVNPAGVKFNSYGQKRVRAHDEDKWQMSRTTALQVEERVERSSDLADSGKIERLRGSEKLLRVRFIAEYLHESPRRAFDLPANNNTVLQDGVFPPVARAARQESVVILRRQLDQYLHGRSLSQVLESTRTKY